MPNTRSPLYTRLVVFSFLAVVMVVIAILAATHPNMSYASIPTSTPTPAQNDAKDPYPFPTRTSNAASSSVKRVEGVPAKADGTQLTENDVRQYVSTKTAPIGPTLSGNAPTVEKVSLVSSKDASHELGNSAIGLPDTENVYLVVLNGPFHCNGVSVPPGVSVPASVDQMYEVFDAKTGNLVLWGI